MKNSCIYIKLRSLYKNKKEKKYFDLRKQFYGSFINKNDLVFDVGANVGNRVEVFLALGAKVVAIEPQKDCRRVLKIKFGNKIDIVSEGVGEKEEERTMYIAESNTISSFSKEWIDDVKENRFSNENWNKTEQIKLTTLEKLISKYGSPRFIKIDVEGFELMVLKGLKQSVDYLSIEYTVPEQIEQAQKCVSYIHNLSNDYKFNYSVGESMKLELDEYLDYLSFIEVMSSERFLNSDFGDIYAKLIS